MIWFGARTIPFVLLLAACSGSPPPPPADPLDCYPAAARRWIARSGDTPSDSFDQRTGKATVYVDRSGSMVGYLNADPLDRPLQDLVETLPGVTRKAGSSAAFRAFGRTISAPVANRRVMQDAGFYRCAEQDKALCENQESHLDAVFERIEANPDDMAVVLSDLWFSNSDIRSTGWASLQPMLSRILESGRTIALYGIPAPFRGRISDLPGAGPRGSLDYRGRHPLFMLVVGSKAQIGDFDAALRDTASRKVARDLATGVIHRAVFTIDPAPPGLIERKPLDRGSDKRIAAQVFEPTRGVAIQQFVLEPGVLRPRGGSPAAPSWTGPKADGVLPDAVWRGPLEARTRIWQRSDARCGPASWLDMGSSKDGWRSGAADGGYTLALTPESLATKLSRPGAVYLVSGQVRRVSVTSPNPATGWMRGPWSLAPEDGARVAAAPPPLFPTMNLDEVARLLEAALRQAARKAYDDPKRADAVAGFSVLVKVQN